MSEPSSLYKQFTNQYLLGGNINPKKISENIKKSHFKYH